MASTTQPPVIVWFREDLRTADHPALTAAVASGAPVIPIFVLDETPERRPLGGASRWWLDKSLRAHAAALEALGARLILRRGPAVDAVLAVAAEAGATDVHWHRSQEGFGRDQDARLAAALAEIDVQPHAHLGGLLTDPGALRTKTGQPFRMYAAFRRASAAKLDDAAPLPAPARLPAPAAWPASDDLASWNLHPTKPDWSTGFTDWTPGEAGAHARLTAFLAGQLARYHEDRNSPHVEGTTRLSPHLRFGEITEGQVLHAARLAAEADPGFAAAREKLTSEVAWREFHYHLLAHNPDMAIRPLRPAFEHFPFREDPVALAAFTARRTGYPIIDAGLRQLWETGWMHNRVRLIAASFFVKHLLLDWRLGEDYFWDTLVDADPANNPASWQWIAGAGVDAAPYFRIFNPVIQGERFDPDGAYVRRWVPELARLEPRDIHQPWKAPAKRLAAAGVDLGVTYPRPMVDHAAARARALAAFAEMREAITQ
jgi:deoxyribodipyrimidine photo-lyase